MDSQAVRRVIEENKPLVLFLRISAILLMAAWLLYGLFARGLIEAMYNGESLGFLNRMIEDQHHRSLESYIERSFQAFVVLNAYLVLILVTLGLLRLRHRRAFGNRAFFVVVGLVLFLTMCLVKPSVQGDGPEYLLMTESFFNHLTPDLREEDIETLESVEERFSFPVFHRQPQQYYFPARDGRLYSYHFWLYPLVNLPVKAALHFLGLHEIKVFQITNALLMILALYFIIFRSAFDELQKRMFSYLLLVSPVFWFIHWAHPEVFSCVLVVMSLVSLSREKWRSAVFWAAVASTQNQPLVLLVAFLWVVGLVRSMHKRSDVGLLTAAALPAVLPNLFYLLKYGSPSLLAQEAASLDNVSLFKALELFFDLNVGMLPYIPLALVLFFGILARDAFIRRRVVFGHTFVPLLLAMMLACTPTILWNHGTTGPNRYVIWMLPLVFYVLANEISSSAPGRKLYCLALWTTIAVQFAIVLRFGGITPKNTQTHHTYLAKFVLNHFPALYNPTHEIFIARTLHRTSAEPEGPVVYYYKGECRKALVDITDQSELESLCRIIPDSKRRFFSSGGQSKERFYVNY